MSQKEMLNNLCKKTGLGNLQEEPVMVTGGLLHEMYCVVTESGRYAIKALNPDIMKRPDALQNMINGELVSNAFKKTVPVVAAKSFGGEYVILCEGAYYMVFDWLEGRSVFGQDIAVSHCAKIGEILGRMHAADMCIPGMENEESVREVYAWDAYLKEAGGRKDEVQKNNWQKLVKDNLAQIKQWDKRAVSGLQALSVHQVISHRDLDPKNVMWQQNRPYVIDWEAAGYVNPYQEMVEVLNYWTVDGAGNYDKDKFDALIGAFADFVDISEVHWETVLYGSMDGMLGWLEYNVKRALGLEGTKPEDRTEGEKQISGTIRELTGYAANMEMCKDWLSHIRCLV